VDKTYDLNKAIEHNRKLFKLCIATPFYEVKAWSPYVSSLVSSIRAMEEMELPWEYFELSGDSYVDRAKNTLAHKFMESDCTHLMMIDSDMSWELEGFLRIVRAALAGFELVGAGYPCKNKWDFYGCIPLIDHDTGQLKGTEIEDMRLLSMACIPGGFICYSRKALEMTQPKLKKYQDFVNDIEYWEYFKCNIEPETGIKVGEDVYFQIRYREMGGIVYLEPNVTIMHWGVKGWAGNYHLHLMETRNNKSAENPI
jgi:hypothetical protein